MYIHIHIYIYTYIHIYVIYIYIYISMIVKNRQTVSWQLLHVKPLFPKMKIKQFFVLRARTLMSKSQTHLLR